jgi:hypothetical protein
MSLEHWEAIANWETIYTRFLQYAHLFTWHGKFTCVAVVVLIACQAAVSY